MAQVLKRLKDSSVTVGIHSDSGQHDDSGGKTVAYIAAVHEYGAEINHPGGTGYVIGKNGMASFVSNSFTGPVHGVTGPHKIKIPERSFLRSTMRTMKDSYQDAMKRIYKKAIKDPSYSTRNAMGKLGRKAEGDVKKAIRDMKSPPNAPSTIAQKKGADNPLIDTGQMLNSVRWKYEGDA